MLQIETCIVAVFNIFHKIMKVCNFLLHFYAYWYKIISIHYIKWFIEGVS